MQFTGVFMTGLGIEDDNNSKPTVVGSFAYDIIKMTYWEFDFSGRKKNPNLGQF